MSRYDSRTTIFSNEGRLFQVEYALETISNASTTIGIVTTEGVVLAANKVKTSKYIERERATEKLHAIDRNIICASAGWTADANVLINLARRISQTYLHTYNKHINPTKLISNLCDKIQSYTQNGGLRPFGLALMFAIVTPKNEFKVVLTDPAGNLNMWKAIAIGQENVFTQSLLKQEYTETLTLQQGLELAAKILKTVGSTINLEASAEFAVLSKQDKGVSYRILCTEEAKDLMINANKVDLVEP